MQSAFRHPFRRLRHKGWIWAEALRQRLMPAPACRWLFSARADWMGGIRHGFRNSGHEIAFGPLTDDAVRAHDVVVPLTIEDVRYLAAHPSLAAHSLIPVPSAAAVDLCDDKLLLNLALQAAGFGDHVPPMGTASRSPFLLKKRVDEHGKSCVILADTLETRATALARHGGLELVQTFVPGRIEHALHVLFRKGRIEWCLNIEYLFATDRPIKGRDAALHQGRSSARHLNLWAHMLNTLGYEGLCCINFKDSERGPQLIEINPRCGGSLTGHFHVLADHVARRAVRPGPAQRPPFPTPTA